MKKVILATVIIAVAALTTLTVSSKTTITKTAELTKVNKTEFAARGFSSVKNDLSSAD